jgi:Rad/Gem-related GTP binding protein 1
MVVVYSVVSPITLQEAEETLQYLWKTNTMTEKAVIMVGNKTDLVRTRAVNIVGKLLAALLEVAGRYLLLGI